MDSRHLQLGSKNNPPAESALTSQLSLGRLCLPTTTPPPLKTTLTRRTSPLLLLHIAMHLHLVAKVVLFAIVGSGRRKKGTKQASSKQHWQAKEQYLVPFFPNKVMPCSAIPLPHMSMLL